MKSEMEIIEEKILAYLYKKVTKVDKGLHELSIWPSIENLSEIASELSISIEDAQYVVNGNPYIETVIPNMVRITSKGYVYFEDLQAGSQNKDKRDMGFIKN